MSNQTTLLGLRCRWGCDNISIFTQIHLALKDDYRDYQSALSKTNLETLVVRRFKLSKNFALKTSKHPKHSKWFVKTKSGTNTQSNKPIYKMPLCRLTRTRKGPIPYPTSLLNSK